MFIITSYLLFQKARDLIYNRNYLKITFKFVPGLFHRAIVQSGTSLCPWAFSESVTKHSIEMANKVGCPLNDDLIECMSTKKAEDLVVSSTNFLPLDLISTFRFLDNYLSKRYDDCDGLWSTSRHRASKSVSSCSPERVDEDRKLQSRSSSNWGHSERRNLLHWRSFNQLKRKRQAHRNI